MFDSITNAGRVQRGYAPKGEVTEVGDKVYVNGEVAGYECTVTCYPDPALTDADGNPGSVKYWDSGLIVP